MVFPCFYIIQADYSCPLPYHFFPLTALHSPFSFLHSPIPYSFLGKIKKVIFNSLAVCLSAFFLCQGGSIPNQEVFVFSSIRGNECLVWNRPLEAVNKSKFTTDEHG